MLIDCPGCAQSYHIVKAALGPNGRRVACPRCDTIWFAAPNGGAQNHELMKGADLAGPLDVLSHTIEEAFPGFPTPLGSPTPTPSLRKRPRLPSSLRDCLAGATVVALGMAVIGLRADIVRLVPQ